MKNRLALLGSLLMVVLLSNFAVAEPVKVPMAKTTVMLDGKIGPGEWDDAVKLSAGKLANIYLKETKDDLWFAMELLGGKIGTLDLYLDPGDGRVVNMHASAKIGQRLLKDGKWPEEWNWWNNDAWVANVSRVDSWQNRTFMPESVREYQISKSWLPKKDFRMMLEIMTKAEPNWETTPYPEKGSNTDPKTWLEFQLQ